jgi:hypothetical protein
LLRSYCYCKAGREEKNNNKKLKELKKNTIKEDI